MTLNDLESDLYRRLGFAATPDPVVTTRLRAYLNQTQRQILSQKGLHKLRQVVLNATAVAGDPYLSIAPASVRVIHLVDRANKRVLAPVPLSDLRVTDPGQTDVTSIPHCYAVISLSAVSARPTTVVGLSAKSGNAGDDSSKTAFVEVNFPLSKVLSEGAVLGGTTAVNFQSSWPIGTYVTKFYLGGAGGTQVLAAGNITLYQGLGATDQPLAIITSGSSTAVKMTRLQLYPIPQTSITYHVDAELGIEDMSIGGDEPLVPEDFHWVLTSGALLKEWQRMEKTAQYDREQSMYREGIGDLKMFVARAAKADGKNGNGNGLHDSSFGPWYPVGGVGSAAPHAPTHEPGGNDPMSVDALPTIGSLRTLGSGPNQAAPGDDPRFTSGGGGPHHLTHESGGSDALSVLLLAGYPGGTTGFLRADATFATPATGGGAHHATHEPGGTDALVLTAASRLFGRGSSSAGAVEEISLGTGLAMSGTTINATGAATPGPHATTHEPGGTDAMAIDAAAAVGSLRTLGAGANQAAPGNDARFTAAPQLHAPTHKSGGSDAIKLDELAAPTDVTTLNASITAHGLLRKLSNVATQFLDGQGGWTVPTNVPGLHAPTHQPGGSDALQLSAASRLFGRGSTGAGAVQEIILGTGLAMTGSQLNATGGALPGAHAISHEPGGLDPMTVDAAPATGSLRTLGTGANQALPGTALANVAYVNQANTFTINQTISAATPALNFSETDQPANLRNWILQPDAQVFRVHAVNDAWANLSEPLRLYRDGSATVGNNLNVTGSGGNVACKDQANTFTQNQVITHASLPEIRFEESAQPANLKTFRIVGNSQLLLVQTMNDAGVALLTALWLDRSGNGTFQGDVYEKSRTTAMGHWVDVAYGAGHFAASAGTWTMGTVTAYAYSLVGKTLHIVFSLDGTNVSATPQSLFLHLAGFTAAKKAQAIIQVVDNGTQRLGLAQIMAGASAITFWTTPLASPNWSTSSGGCWVIGELTVPIQ